MHFHAKSREYDWREPSTFPLGYMNQTNLKVAHVIDLQPGDILGLVSDGIYEYENEDEVQFGHERLAAIIDRYTDGPMDELVQKIMQATFEHGGSVAQADDITIVLIRRVPA